ncbi:MAG: hypothetical protein ACRDXX_19960 [Stackebrandtia sp.]
MSSFGSTWWGKRWLRTLEQLGLTYPDNRISRARTLVNKEAVDLVTAEPGELSAWVDEPRKSFGVVVRLPVYSEHDWEVFDECVAARLGNFAELLDDRLPTAIDRQLEPFGLSLFPAEGELKVECPCKDRREVCVHVIAVQHAFADLLDDDPFLLCVLRGRDRLALLDGLRSARKPAAAAPALDEAVPIATIPAESFYAAKGSLDAALSRGF